MIAIFKREFKSFMHNMTGVIFISFLLIITGIFVTVYNLIIGFSSFQYSIEWTGIAFLVIIPIITMRSLSVDKTNCTDKLLFSLPIKVSHIIMGKFFAVMAVLSIPILVMLIYPVILSSYGYMYYAASYSAILALFLLGISLISICMFISSLTESQVISAVISFGVLLFLFGIPFLAPLIPGSALASFIGFIILAFAAAALIWRLTANHTAGIITAALLVIPQCALYFFTSSLYTGQLNEFLNWFSLYDRFYSLNSGVFDISSVVYFVSVTVFFLFLSTQSLEKRRWS